MGILASINIRYKRITTLAGAKMKILTEISGVSVSLLEDLGLKNSPGTAIYHYYFTEATLRGRKIYRFQTS